MLSTSSSANWTPSSRHVTMADIAFEEVAGSCLLSLHHA
jgi:hypothetical protein